MYKIFILMIFLELKKTAISITAPFSRTERHYIVVSSGKTLDANFFASTLYVVEDKHRCLFHNCVCRK